MTGEVIINLRDVGYIKKKKKKKLEDNKKIKKKKKKLNSSQSMEILNSIIENYYKNKNKNNIDKNENDINNNSKKVKITYSSSWDNKQIRTTSSTFRGPKVTVFQHFNRTHTVNNL